MKDCDLKYGQAYDCVIDGKLGIEKTSIVPLAINAKTTRRFIIFEARKLHAINPRFFKKLLSMTFSEIVEEDISGGPYRAWSCYVWNVALEEGATLYEEDSDAYFVDFVEVDLS